MSYEAAKYSGGDSFNGTDVYETIYKMQAVKDLINPAGAVLRGATKNNNDMYSRLRTWDRQASVVKITPMFQQQRISKTWVSYIMEGLPKPQIQRFPISSPKVTPHQISFDFFDTTEGKIGVSNAKENMMIVEFDVYVSELIYFYWNHAGSKNAGQLKGLDGSGGLGALTGQRFINEERDNFDKMVEALVKGSCNHPYEKGQFRKDGEGAMRWFKSLANPWSYRVNNFEDTQAFIDFRNIFLQQYTGWVCKFTSQIFGIFDGVFTDISYEIEDGYTDAKWHCKIEEAIFTEDYSKDGTKPSASNGDQEESG